MRVEKEKILNATPESVAEAAMEAALVALAALLKLRPRLGGRTGSSMTSWYFPGLVTNSILFC